MKHARSLPSILMGLLLILIGIPFADQVSADTTAPASISADTTWTLSSSPYVVTGPVVVANATLTIEPGVQVKFDKDQTLQIDGALIAKGTAASPIVFTANSADNWGNILFSDSSTDATYDATGNYLSGSILEYCTIEKAGGAQIADNGAVRMDNAHPYLNHLTVRNNKASGIHGWNLSGTLRIANSIISDNTSSSNGAGINVSGSGTGTFYLSNSTITNNDSSLLKGSGGGIYSTVPNATITNNTIANNSISGGSDSAGGGLYIYGTATVSSNIITHNSADAGGGIKVSDGQVNLANNYIANNTARNGGGVYDYGVSNIANNIISDNTASSGIGGIGVPPNARERIFSNNTFTGNKATNQIIEEVQGTFQNNTITQNQTTGSDTYIVSLNTTPQLNNNNIFGNVATYAISAEGGQSNTFSAINNWWGTTTESEIQKMIFDVADEPTRGTVTYTPWASVIRTDAPIAPPTGLTATKGTGKITLTWTANTESDTTGYKVYWDTQDVIHPYANMKDVGKVTSYTITALNPGTYYVAVTAYDKDYALTKDDAKTIVNENQTNGNESWYARTTATIDKTLCDGVTEIPKTQCNALLALYNGTDGPHWTSKAGWNVTTTPCTPPTAWEGITCVSGNVTEIDLTNHALKGTLPDLSALTSLLKLQLGTNQLTSAFPDLTKLTQLQVLDLSKNQLAGKLPDALSSFVTLQTLLLNDNQFNDLIPALNGLSNLIALSLKNNLLVGPIPALDKLSKAKLTTLDLSGNTTTGITALCKDPTRAYGDWATWDKSQGKWITPNDPTSLDTFPTCTGTVSGSKFNDILDNYPANALQDVGEPNLPGQTITVTNSELNQTFIAKDSVTGQAITATLDTAGKYYYVTATTDKDGKYNVTLPYGTYAITSDSDTATYPQQTTPVRIPPLKTPYTVEISWLNKEIKGVLFGVYGPRTLTLSKTQASDTSQANKDNSITATTTGPDSNISCSAATCPLHYTQGQTVTLTANANLTGSTFTSWQLTDASGKVKTITTNPYSITMDQDYSVKANFHVFSCTNVTEISSAQCLALVTLFDNTNGKSWTTSAGWRATLTPCSWSGVTCANGTVTGIALANNNLTGTLPDNFGALTGLLNFDVSGNSGLTGAVPTSLTRVVDPTKGGTIKLSSTQCYDVNADYSPWDATVTSLPKCDNLAPVAVFNILPPKGSLTVALEASTFGDPKATYDWTTSCVPTTNPTATPTPGSTATGQKTSITFTEAATCDITLKVTDSQMQSSTYTQKGVKVPVTTSTSVKSGSTSAAAFYTIPTSGSLTVKLDASLSVDPNGAIDTYTWTTKCGTTDEPGPSATGMTPSLTLPAGTCKITLAVSNSAASTNTSTPTNTSTQANTITQTVTVPATDSTVLQAGDVSGVVFKISPPTGNLTVNVDASTSYDPEGGQLTYAWTTSCGPKGAGMTTAITFPQAETCNITLIVTDVGGKSTSVTRTVTVPAAILTIYKTSKNTAGDEVSSSGRVLVTQPKGSSAMPDAECDPAICVPDKQQYYLSPGTPVQLTAKPYPGSTFTGWVGDGDCKGGASATRISFIIGEGSMNCMANFDLAPANPPYYKLEVQLWDFKTNQQADDTVGGQIIDSRLSINVGGGNHKNYTYYQSGADASGVNRTTRVRLRGLPNHIEKVNSGANVYWEFVQWDCYNAGNSNEKVSLITNSTKTRPLVVFDMPAYSTICRAYFNSEEDIAGQVLRTRTYKEGVIDTGGTPSDRYPMDLGTTPYDTNAARFREGLSWAQPAILTLESFVDPKNLDATWPTQFVDLDFFIPPSPAGTVVEGKKWTKSVRIRGKDAVVKGFSSTGTVLGYYIEVRVMLLNKDKVEEEVPILLLYGDSTGPRRGTRSGGVGAVKWPPNACNKYQKCS